MNPVQHTIDIWGSFVEITESFSRFLDMILFLYKTLLKCLLTKLYLFQDLNKLITIFCRFEHRRHTSVAMNRNYSETSMMSIPADKNNKAIILDVGGKKHKIRGEREQSYED